jgi:magnesium transporter
MVDLTPSEERAPEQGRELPDADELREVLAEAAASARMPDNTTSLERIVQVADDTPPAVLAEAIADLTTDDLRTVLAALGTEWSAEVMSELDPDIAAGVLQQLPQSEAADLLEEMDPDDAADVVGELRDDNAPAAEQLLLEMTAEEQADVRQLLAYPDDSAGGIMTTDFLAVPAAATVEEAVRLLRAPAEDELPSEASSYVYVTETDDTLLGVVPWHRLVRAGGRVLVRDLMAHYSIFVRASDDQETAARIVHDNRLLAVPVVDENGKLLGIVTADDVTDVLEEEATEDIERLGGSEPLDIAYLRAGPLTLARKRVGWLLLLFVGATYTATVLNMFEEQLERVVALTFFIPLLIGTGGNVGSQTVMTVIRAMAVGEVEFRDLFRVWRKELGTSLILGGVLAIAAFVRAWLLDVTYDIALAVAITAAVIVVWAATVASILPLVLRQLRVDPAVVSAPLITTLVDGTGLFLYLMIARWLLGL